MPSLRVSVSFGAPLTSIIYPRKAVENVNLVLTLGEELGILAALEGRHSAGQGGLSSLTTDTMCQNLFETIRVFERGWVE